MFRFWNTVLRYCRFIDYGVVELANRPKQIPERTIVIIGSGTKKKWILLMCPCGCGETLTLSLMQSHKPNWKASKDKWSRVTLSPSVWKNDGCRSHFFIKKGKILWAGDD